MRHLTVVSYLFAKTFRIYILHLVSSERCEKNNCFSFPFFWGGGGVVVELCAGDLPEANILTSYSYIHE